VSSTPGATPFEPYLPALLPAWAAAEPGTAVRVQPSSLVMLDISGFTRLTERLAGRGRAGAEELSDILEQVFSPLVDVALTEGCDLLKWGGDAVLLLATGPDAAVRASRAALRMRGRLGRVGHLRTSVGAVVLRASTAVATGDVVLVLAGDPQIHRELVVLGPAATAVVALEGTARAGQVLVDVATAANVEARLLAPTPGQHSLLLGLPRAPRVPLTSAAAAGTSAPQAAQRPGPQSSPGDRSLAALLPPQLRDRLAQGTHEPDHRVVTVAFLRFDGTDDVLRLRGQAGLAQAVDDLIRNVQDATHRHGVSFHESDVDTDGGKIMLVAGAPLSTGDDVDHMLATVRLAVDRSQAIAVRAGIAHGRVFTGDLGPDRRRTYSVKGGAVNLAARLAARAEPGQVLLPAELLTHSRRRWASTVQEPFRLKGIAAPVLTVALGSASSSSSESQETALCGRDPELAQLRGALDRLAAGIGGSVLLVGDPGMGKTRLVTEMVKAAAADFRVLTADCGHSGAATPYATVGTILGAALGLTAVTDPRQGLQHAEQIIAQAAPELVDRLSLLAKVFDVTIPGAPSEDEHLGEEFRTDALQRLVVDVLRAVLDTPTLLVIEDTHLMDADSARLLAQLLSRSDDMPWLLLATRRGEERGWMPAVADVIALGPLDAKASLSLVELVAPERPLPPAAARQLATRAGGHPLFLRELVLAAARGDELDDLPMSVEELVTVQVDALAPGGRALLRRAAVLGDSFTDRLLREVIGGTAGSDPATLQGELASLSAFLVRVRGRGWRFRHTVHREVAYAGLPVKVRTELHGRVGEVLARSPRTRGNRPEVLAHHFFASGRYDKAWQWARQAGIKASARAAPEAAAHAYAQATEAGARSGTVTPADRVADLESWGDALFLCGRSAESAAAYLRARRLVSGQPVASAGLSLKLAKVAQRQGRYAVALRRTSSGLGVLEGHEVVAGATANRARLLARRSVIRMSQGRYAEADRSAREALRVAERAAHDDATAQAHLVLHGVEVFTGARSGVDHGALALAMYERLGDLSGQAHAHNNVAMRLLVVGDWPQAAERFERAAASFEQVGDAANAANAAYNSADLLNRQGRSAEALVLLGRVSRVARAVEDEELQALVLREQGRAHVRAGRAAEGLPLLASARELFERLHEPHEVCDTDIATAEGQLLAGEPALALAGATEALVLASRLGAATLLPSALRVRASAQLQLGDLGGAAQSLQRGLGADVTPDLAHERGFLLAVRARLEALVAGDPARREVRSAAQGSSARDAAAALERLGVVRAPLPWLPSTDQG
jgi:class 3 adenylate cyclase/tetratricopeptide (TPR) repeat protein